MKYKVDAPYPVIKVEQLNTAYGAMILDNVGGMCSEMSAISLYSYNHVILGEIYPDLQKAFEQISIVEMHHLGIFSQLSYMLGMDPRLWSCSEDYAEYWSPSYNNYLNQLDGLLENAIINEKKVIEKYTSQASIINDRYIVAILNRIIEDEKLHVEMFESFYKELFNNS